MTEPNRTAVRDVVVAQIHEVRDDWDISTPVTEATGLFNDIGFESIDAVALGAAIEEHYDRQLPFADFLTKANEEKWPDVTVGQLVDFLLESLPNGADGK